MMVHYRIGGFTISHLNLFLRLAFSTAIFSACCSAYHVPNVQFRRHCIHMSEEAIISIGSTGAPKSRRSLLAGGSFIAMLSAATTAAPTSVSAASPPDITDVSVENFTFSLPSNWKIITKPADAKNKKKRSKLFSAIDLQSGSVLTVVQEQACSVQEYAQSQNRCDVVLTPDKDLLSGDNLPKDISKLIIRHDDRDNTALQGTTKLDSYQASFQDQNNVVDLIATTTIPSGGTYRDTMGIDRPNTIDRRVKAKAVVVNDGLNDITVRSESLGNGARILSLWLSAPSDEWQKPVMGTKLNKIWGSVKYGK